MPIKMNGFLTVLHVVGADSVMFIFRGHNPVSHNAGDCVDATGRAFIDHRP